MNKNYIGVYAAYSTNDDLLLKSSSGATFSILAEFVLQNEGVVYGVAMTDDCKAAVFVRATDKDQIEHLRGSKYLQARVGKTFLSVKDDLENGKTVMFTGTPCQINGLKAFLGKTYENLICVDVVCHGVPSPKLWRKYVEYEQKRNNASMIGVNFRCKDNGWYEYGIKELFSGTKLIYTSKDNNPFMIMFLRNHCLRPSCYNCIAKGVKMSDITMADFWGINMVFENLNDNKGVSLVIVRTAVGEKLIKDVGDLLVTKAVSYEDGVRFNKMEYESSQMSELRQDFSEDINKMGFEELKKKYATPDKIGFKTRIKRFAKSLIKKVINIKK